jgi:hypothetical protein
MTLVHLYVCFAAKRSVDKGDVHTSKESLVYILNYPVRSPKLRVLISNYKIFVSLNEE